MFHCGPSYTCSSTPTVFYLSAKAHGQTPRQKISSTSARLLWMVRVKRGGKSSRRVARVAPARRYCPPGLLHYSEYTPGTMSACACVWHDAYIVARACTKVRTEVNAHHVLLGRQTGAGVAGHRVAFSFARVFPLPFACASDPDLFHVHFMCNCYYLRSANENQWTSNGNIHIFSFFFN